MTATMHGKPPRSYRFLWAFLTMLALVVVLTVDCADAVEIPDPIRPVLQRSAERWLPGVDWRLWAAQVYQESRYDCRAVSPVGARGCAQIMPATWRELTGSLGWQAADPFSVELNIEAGAVYMARMRAVWRAPRPERDRHDLAMASYNAGAGNIIKAQKFAGGAMDWPAVAKALPSVTGRHASETLVYVDRINHRWYPQLVVRY